MTNLLAIGEDSGAEGSRYASIAFHGSANWRLEARVKGRAPQQADKRQVNEQPKRGGDAKPACDRMCGSAAGGEKSPTCSAVDDCR